MEGSRKREEKHGSPSTSAVGSRHDQSFDAELRRKQIAEKLGVSNVVVLGMHMNGVNYRGVLLPEKECKIKKK